MRTRKNEHRGDRKVHPGSEGELAAKVIFRAILVVAFFSGICLAGDKPELNDEKEKISYSIGYQIGGDFKRQGIDFAPDILLKGIQDGAGGAKPRIPPREMRKTLTDLRKKVDAEEGKRQKRESREVPRGRGGVPRREREERGRGDAPERAAIQGASWRERGSRPTRPTT